MSGEPRPCANCSWQWFHLRDPEPYVDAAVSVDSEGLIIAYSGGIFECARCGEHLDALPYNVTLKVIE